MMVTIVAAVDLVKEMTSQGLELRAATCADSLRKRSWICNPPVVNASLAFALVTAQVYLSVTRYKVV
jgi:hypothetical protein